MKIPDDTIIEYVASKFFMSNHPKEEYEILLSLDSVKKLQPAIKFANIVRDFNYLRAIDIIEQIKCDVEQFKAFFEPYVMTE